MFFRRVPWFEETFKISQGYLKRREKGAKILPDLQINSPNNNRPLFLTSLPKAKLRGLQTRGVVQCYLLRHQIAPWGLKTISFLERCSVDFISTAKIPDIVIFVGGKQLFFIIALLSLPVPFLMECAE